MMGRVLVGRVGVLARALALVGVAPGCTVLSDFDVHQCDSSAECDVPGGEISRCLSGRCVPGCDDNAHCASVDPRVPVCQRPGGECVGLSSPEGACHASTGYDGARMGGGTALDLIVLGAFAPSVRSSTWLSASLAVSELNAAGGLPGPNGARPVVLVLCDAAEPLDDALTHLIERLQVRALVASLPAGPLRAAVEAPDTRGRALFLSPSGFSASLEPRNDSSLLHLGTEYEATVPLYAALLRQTVDTLEAAGRAPGELRIASLVGAGEEDGPLASSVASAITVGGIGRDELVQQGRLSTVELAPDEVTPPAELSQHEPDLVLVFTGGHSTESPYPELSSVVAAFEASGSYSPDRAPRYVLGPRNARDATLARLAASDASFRRRVVGVRADALPDVAIQTALSERFADAYPNLEGDAFVGVAFDAYDATYHLAYALASALPSDESLVAGDVANGLSRVTDPEGPRVDVGPGPTGLDLAIDLLESRTPFDLHGTKGRVRFDRRGRRRSQANPRAYCWNEEGRAVDVAHDDLSGGLELEPANCAEDFFGASPE